MAITDGEVGEASVPRVLATTVPAFEVASSKSSRATKGKSPKTMRAKRAKAKAKALAKEEEVVGQEETLAKEEVVVGQEEPLAKEEVVVPAKGSSSSSVARVIFPQLVDNPHCSKCKKQLDPFKAQVAGKARGSWKCNTCNTRSTQLSRIAAWDELNKSFKDFTPEQVTAWWQKIGEATDSKDLEKMVTETISVCNSTTKESSSGGQYLPLSVYEKRGFDIQRIQVECKDTQLHPILGLTYKIRLSGDVDKSLETTTREKRYSKKESLNKKKRKAASDDSSEASDDDDSTSSGKRGKKDKGKDKAKGKPSKKEKKVKEKKEREEHEKKDREKLERAAKAKAGKDRGDATKILSKLVSATCLLESELKQKLTTKLPTFAVNQAQSALDSLMAIKKNAEDCIKKGSELNHTLPEVADAVKTAQSQTTFLSSMLAAARGVA